MSEVSVERLQALSHLTDAYLNLFDVISSNDKHDILWALDCLDFRMEYLIRKILEESE